jgi:hypothetical protein
MVKFTVEATLAMNAAMYLEDKDTVAYKTFHVRPRSRRLRSAARAPASSRRNRTTTRRPRNDSCREEEHFLPAVEYLSRLWSSSLR